MDSGHLRLGRYSLPYRARLIEGASHLKKFLDKNDTRLKQLLGDPPDLVDQQLEKYVVASHSHKKHGKALRVVKHAVLFVQVLRPELKRNLKRTWENLKSWEETVPSNLRTPLPAINQSWNKNG